MLRVELLYSKRTSAKLPFLNLEFKVRKAVAGCIWDTALTMLVAPFINTLIRVETEFCKKTEILHHLFFKFKKKTRLETEQYKIQDVNFVDGILIPMLYTCWLF